MKPPHRIVYTKKYKSCLSNLLTEACLTAVLLAHNLTLKEWARSHFRIVRYCEDTYKYRE